MANVTIRSTHTPSGKSDILTTTVIAAPQTGDWPNNEPAEMQEIVAIDGSTLNWTGGGGWTPGGGWTDPARLAVVADPASKYGSAVQKRWKVGDSAGWNGLNIGRLGAWRELYMRAVYLISQNYQRHPTGGEKLFYYNKGGGASTFPFVVWHTASNSSNSPSWSDGSSSNTCVPQKLTGGDYGELPRDQYHTIEVHHGASLTPGTGFLRMWIDGVRIQQFRKFSEGIVNGLENRTWFGTGGSDGTVKTLGHNIETLLFWGGEGGAKAVNDYLRLSELYISGRN